MTTLNNIKRFLKREILFCDINDTCYMISMQKEIFKKEIRDFKTKPNFASVKNTEPLPNLIEQRQSNLIKRGPSVELSLQQGKAKNIAIASQTMNGVVIKPGEELSF